MTVLRRAPPPCRPHSMPHFHPRPRSVLEIRMGCRTDACPCSCRHLKRRPSSEPLGGASWAWPWTLPASSTGVRTRVSKGTWRVMARTVSSMLTVVLVAVGLAPGDGKLETLIPKPWTCRCEASSRAPIYFYFTYYSIDLQCIH